MPKVYILSVVSGSFLGLNREGMYVFVSNIVCVDYNVRYNRKNFKKDGGVSMREAIVVGVVTISLSAIMDCLELDRTTSKFIKITGYSFVALQTVLWVQGMIVAFDLWTTKLANSGLIQGLNTICEFLGKLFGIA